MKKNSILFLFLNCISICISAATYTVTSTTNGTTGDGVSLRWAITQANANPGNDLINFNFGAGASPYSISITSTLPALTDNSGVTIDGWNILGGGSNTPNTVALFNTSSSTPLNGQNSIVLSNATNVAVGLVITSSNNIVKGLVLQNFGDGIADFNDIGISISGNNNQILGCIIGLDYMGVTKGTRTNIGVYISGNSNSIGDGTPAGVNIISGMNNNGTAIYLDASAGGNAIEGNMLGLQRDGSTQVVNTSQSYGIFITSSAIGNTIGGSTLGEGNVISGNTIAGIYMGSTLPSGNTVLGNIIGPRADGTYVTSNVQFYGIYIVDSQMNIIGGGSGSSGNIISANEFFGISIYGAGSINNTIKGNNIGLDKTGTSFISGSSQDVGIAITNLANNNTIGGAGANEGNTISGNTASGVRLNSASINGNTVVGNIIGPQDDGISFVAYNQQTIGIDIDDSPNNTIGLPITGIKNIISANQSYGIYITGSVSTTNAIQNNYIGIDRTGTSFIPGSSQIYGIYIANGSSNNVIGGKAQYQTNVISGNTSAGINTNNTDFNSILGNIIGLQANGISYLSSNQQTTGILIAGPNNIIGHSDSGAENIISGNETSGIQISNTNASYNTIEGNLIGLSINKTQVGGANQDYGIYFTNGARNNTIGGANTNSENHIAYNTTNGIYMDIGTTIQNKITKNLIYNNNGKPIDLNYGMNGANSNNPAPVISSATLTNVSGTASANNMIELFKNNSGNCNNAESYIGTTTADATGNWSITVSLSSGDRVLATATDNSNNTSEFSSCISLCGAPVTSSQNPVICYGTSFTMPDGSSQNTSGTYMHTIPAYNGCDSIITTSLTVSAAITGTQNITMCYGDSVLFAGTYYYATGNYPVVLTAFNGCDSTATLNLTENTAIASTQNTTMCFGDSVLFAGTYYYATGNYPIQLIAFNGCDSMATLNLTESTAIVSTQNTTMCFGDSVLFAGTYYYATGNYPIQLTAFNGCDSMATLNLTESTAIVSTQNTTMCFGDSVLFAGTYYYATGNYPIQLTAFNGCDSMATLNLTENTAIASVQNTTMCFGDSVLFAGTYYYTTGNYPIQLTAFNGCDSMATLNLTENTAITASQNITLCFGDSVQVGINHYFSNGTYNDILTSFFGCDSSITTNVTVKAAINNTQNITLCNGDSLIVGPIVYHSSGTYNDTLIAFDGCDSALTTTLFFNPLPMPLITIDSANSTKNSTLLMATGGISYSWTPSNGLSAITGNIVIASPSITTTYCVEVTDVNGCSDSSCITLYRETIGSNCGELFVPSAFSPNNDGLNDALRVKIKEDCVEEFNLLIYNRWGEKVFESKDINTVWDGTYKGKKLNDGIFVYYLNIKLINESDTISQSGNISLVN